MMWPTGISLGDLPPVMASLPLADTGRAAR
jgi:hypothetical protein